jgi:4-alpha-glucanotransferase
MRASGILLPVSSLPGKYGIGCFSKEAYDFVDVLEKANQKYWQILPIGPTAMEIHHISHFQLLREILILLVWKN